MRSRLLPLIAVAFLVFPSNLFAAPAIDEQSAEVRNLLKDVDIDRDTVSGNWKIVDGQLVVDREARPARLKFRSTPVGDYRVALQFERPNGGDALGIYLPVGDSMVALLIRKQQVGLDTVDGKRFDVNETTNRGNFGDKNPRSLIVDVSIQDKKARIQVVIDDKKYIDWSGPISALRVNGDWSIMGLHSLALGSWNTAFVIQSFELQGRTNAGPGGKSPRNPIPAAKLPTNSQVPLATPSDNSSPANISVASAPPPATPIVEKTPADPDAIERPEFRNKPHPLIKSITSVTGMVVRINDDGDMMGFTTDIIATVDPDSRNGTTSGIGIIRSDGDSMMRIALDEAVRAVKLRYPIWEPGHIDISFGEKFVAHGGPSAGTAFGLLMLSTLEGFDIDPKCAVTGDITVDWKVRKVGGVTDKLHGATLDKCLYAAIPEDNEVGFADMALLYGTSALYDIQVFSIATLQDAEHIARTDRPAKLAEAIKLFNDLKIKLTENEKLTLHTPETIKTLQRILELAPNDLSAKYLLLAAEGKAAKTLSANATLYRIDIILAPYRRVAAAGQTASRETIPLGVTLNARKQIAALRPIVNKEFQPLLTETSAYVEALEEYVRGESSWTAETLNARARAIDASFDELAGDKDLRARLMREGY